MKKTGWIAVVVLVLSALVLSACGGGGEADEETRQSPPSDYASATNPFAGDQAAADAGKALFTTNCASCHGEKGAGDGAAAASLDPKPANLQKTAKETEPVYQHWVISEGGAAAGLSSTMPAFKGALSDEDIWKIVTHLEMDFGK